jgi:hypothetical protein
MCKNVKQERMNNLKIAINGKLADNQFIIYLK